MINEQTPNQRRNQVRKKLEEESILVSNILLNLFKIQLFHKEISQNKAMDLKEGF